jgi:probable F420-dependent oxidoreductase
MTPDPGMTSRPDQAPGAAVRVGLTSTGRRDEVAALEALPIDSLWVGGHVASVNPTPEAMVALARLSATAERVLVGTSILLLPLYPPAVVAKQVADLDRATDGRIRLGVGVGGEYPAEFRACGIPLGERGQRADEAIGLLRRFWTGEPVSHAGPFYPMDDVRIHPAPVQPGGPPVIVAGRRPPAMRRAATLGDGWMPYLYSARRYAASVATIREMAAAAGRDLSGFEWYAYLFVNADDDGDRARQEAARFLGGTYRQDFASMLSSVAVAGTPAEVTVRLRAFVEAGARHLILVPATRDDRWPMIRRLATDVLPAVAEGGSPSAPSTQDRPAG